MEQTWRERIPHNLKCSDFKNFNAYCSAKAKLRVICPYCQEEKSYSSMDTHIALKHSSDSAKEITRQIMKENNNIFKEKSPEKYKLIVERGAVKRKERYICECGLEICRGSLTRHIQTVKHQNLINHTSFLTIQQTLSIRYSFDSLRFTPFMFRVVNKIHNLN